MMKIKKHIIGARVVDAAPETIQRVGWEDNRAAVSQAFQNHLDVTGIGIGRIEFEYHRLVK